MVSTNMLNPERGNSKDSLIIPSAKTFVESALRTVGIADETSCYYVHIIINKFVVLLNFFMPTLCAKLLHKCVKNFDKTQQFYV
jgi:hypothetical protein